MHGSQISRVVFVACVPRLHQERGFQVVTEGCSFVICQVLHILTDWLFKSLFQPRATSLSKQGAGSCFSALSYTVDPERVTFMTVFKNKTTLAL